MWIEEQNPEPAVPITILPIGKIRVIFSNTVEIEDPVAVERFREIQQEAIERINNRFEQLVMSGPRSCSVYEYRTGRRL